MATYTENFDLVKPDDEDYYDVADFNANMDIIDAELGAVAAQANSAEIADKIGQPADTVLNTVFGKINGFISTDGKGVRIIKSIQHVTYSIPTGTNHGSKNINTVNPERCIVLFERLSDSYGNGVNYIEYTLSANAISLTHAIFGNATTNIFGFWIIEFY